MMTEAEARALCQANQATLSLRKRKGRLYVYVCRFLPRTAAVAQGRKVSASHGQQFDRYVCALTALSSLTPTQLLTAIAALPVNPLRARATPVFVMVEQVREYLWKTKRRPSSLDGAGALTVVQELAALHPAGPVAQWLATATPHTRARFTAEYDRANGISRCLGNVQARRSRKKPLRLPVLPTGHEAGAGSHNGGTSHRGG